MTLTHSLTVLSALHTGLAAIVPRGAGQSGFDIATFTAVMLVFWVAVTFWWDNIGQHQNFKKKATDLISIFVEATAIATALPLTVLDFSGPCVHTNMSAGGVPPYCRSCLLPHTHTPLSRLLFCS